MQSLYFGEYDEGTLKQKTIATSGERQGVDTAEIQVLMLEFIAILED